jgi:hypothetical protein
MIIHSHWKRRREKERVYADPIVRMSSQAQAHPEAGQKNKGIIDRSEPKNKLIRQKVRRVF